MALEKFHEKDIVLFGLKESTPGTAQTAITASNGLAVTDASGMITTVTGELVYKGAKNDRSVSVYQKDGYGEVTIDTPAQVVGSLTFPLTEANFPLDTYLTACGGYRMQDSANKWVSWDNSILTDQINASIIMQKSTAGTNQNVAKDMFFYGMVGTVDVNFAVADAPPTYKFNLKGSVSFAYRKARLQPNVSLQQTLLAPTIRFANIRKAQLVQLNGAFKTFATPPVLSYTAGSNVVVATVAGLGTALGNIGDYRAINLTLSSSSAESQLFNGVFFAKVTGATTCEFRIKGIPTLAVPTVSAITYGPAPQSFCMVNMAASNYFGLDVQRVLNSCEEGWEISAINTDVTMSFLEKHSNRGRANILTSVGTTATLTYDNSELPVTPIVGDLITVDGASNVLYNVSDAAITAVNTTVQGAYTVSYVIAANAAAAVITTTTFEITNQTTVFEPEANLLDYFGFVFQYGTPGGKLTTYVLDKLQLTSTKDGKSGVYYTKDLTWKNTGSAYLRSE